MNAWKICLLSMAFFVCIMPVSAFSGTGSGTESDPFVITNVYQLQEMNENPLASYVLENDIDASITVTWNDGAGFIPIREFNGRFDGKGHVIKNLYIRAGDCVGLFGRALENAVIKNCGLENVNVAGSRYVGALVGYSKATILNCYSTGFVSGQYHVVDS